MFRMVSCCSFWFNDIARPDGLWVILFRAAFSGKCGDKLMERNPLPASSSVAGSRRGAGGKWRPDCLYAVETVEH